MRPEVTIITPSHDSAKFIAETMVSVQRQTFMDWEHIIVDDASTDDTVQVAKRTAAGDKRIRIIPRKTNGGGAAARNDALRQARGRYIAFLDSDDLWHPDKLARQLAFMRESCCAFTFTAYGKIDETGRQISSVQVPDKVNYRTLLKSNVIGCLTAVYDADKLGKIEMPLIRKRQDFGLWLAILRTIPYAHGLNETLANYRVRPGSVSGNKLQAARYTWKLYREVECLSWPWAAYVFSHYAVRGLLRR